MNPDLVVRNPNGEIYSVRYGAVNAMLLNEFLKEHNAFLEEQRKVQEQQAAIAQLQSTVRRNSRKTSKRQLPSLASALKTRRLNYKR